MTMAVTMMDIVTVMIAIVLCFLLTELAKWYVANYCQDNPEIIWIWLDDEPGIDGGHRVKNDNEEKQSRLELSPNPCA